MSDKKVAYCEIFPKIGIARLGNSDEFFIGPEAPGLPASGKNGAFKDEKGFILRQGARFRIYSFDEEGNVIEEIQAGENTTITWRVSLANKKASWHQFVGGRSALDIFEGRPPMNPSPLRNQNWSGDRRELVIKSSGSVSGINQSSGPFSGAIFKLPSPVYLGELRTDEVGRLIVLGGHGESGAINQDEDYLLSHYANNDCWHDDTSDGPVEAEVTVGQGETAVKVPVKGRAWVVVTPPDFSPHTDNLVTLFDVIEETALTNNLKWHASSTAPPLNRTKVSFLKDIYPLLHCIVDLQWVNKRVARGHGAGKPMNFLADDTLAMLADPKSSDGSKLRKRILGVMRDPNLDVYADPPLQEAIDQANYSYMPQLGGDEGDPIMGKPGTWLSLTKRQYESLRLWAANSFDGYSSINELKKAIDSNQPVQLEKLPLDQQPFALTKSNLEPCAGGPFYPGIEMTSIVQSKKLFSKAFELADDLEAGDITKWMALPWQADFYECSVHWWPAQRPDDVVSEFDFQEARAKFPIEVDAKALDTLLFPRKNWDRGTEVGRVLRPSFAWPEPNTGEALDAYATRCHDAFISFTHGYWIDQHDPVAPDEQPSWRIPRVKKTPLVSGKKVETLGRYQFRLREFFDRYSGKLGLKGQQWNFPLPPEAADEEPDKYRKKVVSAFSSFVDNLPPKPLKEETLPSFLKRLKDDRQPWNGFITSTIQLGYEQRQQYLGDNNMVGLWKTFGFVVPASGIDQRILIEVGRGKYDGLRDRDYFYFMMNYSEFPDFESKAKELAHRFLNEARRIQKTKAFKSDPDQRIYEFFKYSPSTLEARLLQIYNQWQVEGAAFDPSVEGWRRQDVVARILQLAPFNQLDGAWLRNVTNAGPISDVNSFLFEIWSDETGNGDPSLNHSNLYTALLQSLGIYLPELKSRGYAYNSDIFDSAYTSPLFELVISQFSEDFFPEILGMTLQLEWEVLTLWFGVKRLEKFGINAQFYRMHIGIDNADDGHGAKAKLAVQQFLDHIRAKSGDEEVAKQWERIWTGYAAFATTGDTSNDLEIQRDFPPTIEQRMIDMINRKLPLAQLNHGNGNMPKFGYNRLNDWFEDPQALLDQLTYSNLISIGDPDGSLFVNDRTTYKGPMYKVFTPDELKLWADWIRWLAKQYGAPTVAPMDPAAQMRQLVETLSAKAVNISAHKARNLTAVINGRQITQSLANWFGAGPVQLMTALADPANQLIVSGDASQSSLLATIIPGSQTMSDAIDAVVIDGKTGLVIIRDWINDGCKLPPEAKRGVLYKIQSFGPDAVH